MHQAYWARKVSLTIAFVAAIISGLVYHHAVQERTFADVPVSSETAPKDVMPVAASSAELFLSSLGVNIHVAQGYDPNSYIEPLLYTGIRQVRDGSAASLSQIMIHQRTGVHFVLNGGGDLSGLVSAARRVAAAGALLALEGPNEPNNFPIWYNGKLGGGIGGTWVPVAEFQIDLYRTVRHDAILHQYPVFSPSEIGAETDDVGLQFMTIPMRSHTLFQAATRFSDYVNVHNYVTGTRNQYGDNQAWNAADPTLNAHWDGLYGNNGVTWYRSFQGYTEDELLTLPRVTTETGWDTASNTGGEPAQGTVLTNAYLAQFKRGWRYTFIYEMRDDEGGAGNQGLYHGSTPKLAATYIHNLTSILSDNILLDKPGIVKYLVTNEPPTVHDLLLQKSTGQFELIVWDERARGSDRVTVEFGNMQEIVKIYDITVGTTAVRTLDNTKSVDLVLSDHAMIVELTRQH
jgi:hypothetical protein